MKDTLNIITDPNFNYAFVKLAKDNNSMEPIYQVLFTVLGMIIVAIITVMSQHWITKKNIRADFDKLNKQISTDFEKAKTQLKLDIEKNRLQVLSDFKMKIIYNWISSIRVIIADLITTTDPDFNDSIDKVKMLHLINQAQLLLDENIYDERNLNKCLSDLGTIINDNSIMNKSISFEILRIQNDIINSTRAIIKKKQNENL